MTTEAFSESKPPSDAKPKVASKEEARDILRRAEEGDAKSLSELRGLLDDETRGNRLIERYGSPAHWLESRLIQQSAGKNIAIREAMNRKLSGLRAELAGPSPSPLEQLLVERAVLCWLTVHVYEDRYATAGEMSYRQAEFHERRIDRAHSRFLSAVKTLATVRKLALPALQVNIAENQVNAGPRPSFGRSTRLSGVRAPASLLPAETLKPSFSRAWRYGSNCRRASRTRILDPCAQRRFCLRILMDVGTGAKRKPGPMPPFVRCIRRGQGGVVTSTGLDGMRWLELSRTGRLLQRNPHFDGVQ